MIKSTALENQGVDLETLIFKALTHPARLAILRILQDGEHCVCHMEAHLGYRQAYISQQLSVLREAGLIRDRRDGWNIFYSVNKPEIYEVLETIERISGKATKTQASESISCPCPHCTKTKD